jgi:hypothetical protein
VERIGVWHLQLFKYIVPPCFWKHHRIIFLLGQCVSVLVGWFVAGGLFSLLLLSPSKITA